MVYVKKLTVNDFQENTYLVYDDTKECVIIDPGATTQVSATCLLIRLNTMGLSRCCC